MSSYFHTFIILPYPISNILILLSLILVLINFIIFNKISRLIYLINFFINFIYNISNSYLNNKIYNFYIVPLFTSILFINILGFSFYIIPITSHISVTIGLALSFSISNIIIIINKYGINKYISHFLPSNTPILLSILLVPIEIISLIIKPLSLGLRLAANLTAGHLLINIISSFLLIMIINLKVYYAMPVIILLILIILLEIIVIIVQSYIFCLLTLLYIQESI
uniref:ATP synthase F0 subunit 6 n=1 Tax=Gymnopraia lapislazula TaxID=316224 RepID=UPI0026E21EDD|nr:ATP synthase F0 subunit 6 [Gymnopraia lapislazula]WJJ70112.1 ATP synthase F0 subunit 6 [Gymnopraia lapislazula]